MPGKQSIKVPLFSVTVLTGQEEEVEQRTQKNATTVSLLNCLVSAVGPYPRNFGA